MIKSYSQIIRSKLNEQIEYDVGRMEGDKRGMDDFWAPHRMCRAWLSWDVEYSDIIQILRKGSALVLRIRYTLHIPRNCREIGGAAF